MVDYQVVKMPKSLMDKLKARKHPGQTLAGVVEELLNESQYPKSEVPHLPNHSPEIINPKG